MFMEIRLMRLYILRDEDSHLECTTEDGLINIILPNNYLDGRRVHIRSIKSNNHQCGKHIVLI